MEDVRPVLVHEHAGLIVVVVGVAPDMHPLVHDQHALAGPLASRSASTDPANPATDHEVIEHHRILSLQRAGQRGSIDAGEWEEHRAEPRERGETRTVDELSHLFDVASQTSGEEGVHPASRSATGCDKARSTAAKSSGVSAIQRQAHLTVGPHTSCIDVETTACLPPGIGVFVGR